MAINCSFCGNGMEDGEMVCARCGSELADDYTDFAEVVEETEVPRRVEEITQPAGEVLVCPSCAVQNPVNNDYCESCGAPLGVVTRVYKVDSEEEGDRVDWLVYGIETSTTGRETDLLKVEQTFRVVIEESRSCVCLVTGQPGIGKSRLVREFNAQLDSKFPNALMVTGKARDSDHLPYAPIARLIRKRFYIPQLEIPRLARQRLLDAVTSIIASTNATEIAHLVGYLIGLPFPESPFYEELEIEDATNRHVEDRATVALARFLERDAQKSPLILVIEDVDHATDETLMLVRSIASQLRDSPIFFVLIGTAAVFEDRPDVFEGSHLGEHIELAPLADEDIRGLVADILQRVPEIPEPLMQQICSRALGNPLMVEEICKILIGEGVIDTRPQSWAVQLDKLDEVELPSELEGVVKARIDTLSFGEKECLGVASVIGQTFWLGALLALMRSEPLEEEDAGENIDTEETELNAWQPGTAAARLADLLESLRRKDMIRPHADSLFKGEAEFVFKHGVERDLVYDAIEPERRKRLHLRAAQWYELHGRLDRFANTMARHWEKSGNKSQAAYRYVQAANLARARYLNAKAIRAYTKALEYLPDSDILTRIEAHHNLGTTYELVGDVESAMREYEVLLALSWSLNAKAKGGMALNKIGRIHRSLGTLNESLSTFKRALMLFQQANDLRGIASTLDDIGRVHFIRADYSAALKHYRAALELRRQLKDPRSIALSLHHLGNLKLSQGAFDDALVDYRESLELRKEAGDRQGVADTLNNLGVICMERGESQQALRLWEEALTIAQDIGYRLMEGVLLNNIGESALLMGALKTAESSLHDAVSIAQECADLNLLCQAQRNLGTLFLKNALFDQAVGALTASLSIARDMESRLLEALALRGLGELWAQTLFDESGDDDSTPQERAEECFTHAVELLREVGNDAELGRCLSAQGNFLLEQGRIEEGREMVQEAAEIFERLEMRKAHQKASQTIGEL